MLLIIINSEFSGDYTSYIRLLLESSGITARITYFFFPPLAYISVLVSDSF